MKFPQLFGFNKHRCVIYSNPDDERPVKTVQTGPNSWQIVYADEKE